MAWYNSSWLKRKPVTNTGGASGAQTDYQMKYTITYDSDMKSDFSDLRFTKSDGTTLLDAWMESYTASTSAVVWVETDTPANIVESDIYMYYGNSGATSNWSGANTFINFIDKNTTAGWTTSNITVTTSGDYLRFYNTVTASQGIAYRPITTPTKYAIDYKYHNTSLGSVDNLIVITYDGSLSHRKTQWWSPYSTIQNEWRYYTGTTYTGGSYSEGTEYIFTTVCDDSDDATGTSYYLQNTSRTVLSSAVNKGTHGSPTNADYLRIGDSSTAAEIDAYFQWIIIRNHVNDPATYAFGSEQTEGGWAHKILGITSPGKVINVVNASIGKIIGV